ncbi:MAG: hypothetical protein IJN29_04235 [Akkermansia sp.]|nr:hypothetical protein [Akkermansia sp.]
MTEENSSYPPAPEGSVRLNKFLAACGYESRRAADRLIAEGRVEVNGKAVDTPGLRVLPTDFVKVDGRHATPKEEVVLLLNKPRGYVCSRDAQGAIGTVYDLLPPKYRYANYVGRLDADSEGLIIFTNNGTLGQSIGHPSGGIEKEYWVTLDQAFDNSVLIQLLKGVRIPEGQAKAKYISRLSARRACVVLEQGLKRQVRQMFSCLGLRVKKLVRVRIGSLWGGDLEPGQATLMTAEQIAQATTNPRRRKGLIGAKQAFKPRPQMGHSAATQDDDDDNYVFNPDDFETEEEALETSTKFTAGEAFEPERDDTRRPFGRAPRNRREFTGNDRGPRRAFGNDRGERRSFSDRERRSFGNDRGERRSFGDRERRSFGNDRGERRSFGDRERRSFSNDRGERRSFGDRERRSFGNDRGERRSFGDRERRSFSNDRGERRSFSGERKSFNQRPSFGERRNTRTFNKRRPYDKGRGE